MPIRGTWHPLKCPFSQFSHKHPLGCPLSAILAPSYLHVCCSHHTRFPCQFRVGTWFSGNTTLCMCFFRTSLVGLAMFVVCVVRMSCTTCVASVQYCTLNATKGVWILVKFRSAFANIAFVSASCCTTLWVNIKLEDKGRPISLKSYSNIGFMVWNQDV